MQDELGIDLRGKHVLMVSALDRFGMAQALVDAGADVLFGDFIFALDKDMPVRDLHEFERMAEKYLPDACKLPFQFFYPTGKKQEKPPEPKYPQYYDEAEIIAGDFHFMRQFMPERLDGKIVLDEHRHARQRRGARRARRPDADHDDARYRRAVRSEPTCSRRRCWRCSGKRWSDVVPADYERVLHELRLKPRVVELRIQRPGSRLLGTAGLRCAGGLGAAPSEQTAPALEKRHKVLWGLVAMSPREDLLG